MDITILNSMFNLYKIAYVLLWLKYSGNNVEINELTILFHCIIMLKNVNFIVTIYCITQKEVDMKSVTMRDVAIKANVASSTVSRYINRSGYVDYETGKRIFQAIKDLKYQLPQRNIQKSFKKNLILLAVSDISNPFFSSLCYHTQNILSEKGYNLVVFDTQNSKLESTAIEMAKSLKVRGVLLTCLQASSKIKSELADINIPTVILNSFGNFNCDCVHVDGCKATYIACKHLISLGHKHIIYAGGLENTAVGHSRLEGYMEAMNEDKLDIGPKNIMQLDLTQKAGYEIGRNIAMMKPLPTAVCCANDIMALGLLSALQERGIKIPDDISVTGIDDIAFAGHYSPSLTTVTNSPQDFAQLSISYLLSRIQKTYTGPARSKAIKHQLVIRVSTSAPRD